MSRISLNLVVHNEEERLPEFLAHILPLVDEVIAVVQQSTDRTLELLRPVADVLIEHPHYGYAEASRQAAYDASTGDWVLILSPDERLSAYAQQHLRSWVANPNVDAYALREVTTIGGALFEDAYHPRLFRKGTATMTSEIHTEIQCATGRLVNAGTAVAIEHHKTLEEQRIDNERYARLNSPSIPLPAVNQ